MKKSKPSLDGVSQRPRRAKLGDFENPRPVNIDAMKARKQDAQQRNKQIGFEDAFVTPETMKKDPIESSRSDVDVKKLRISKRKARRKSRRLARRQKNARRHPIWRASRRLLIVGGLSVILLGGVIALQGWLALQNIIDRDGDGAIALQENIDPSQLNGEGDGRVNIMLLGIGGDNHDGGDLADSIIVASFDPFAKEVALLSIPRDLRVSVPGYYDMKVNAVHALGEQQDEAGGNVLMVKTLEQVLDIPIHYYVRLDFEGFRQAVDAVGGVNITLENPIYDNNFDWQYGRDALRLPAGENYLNGTTALLLARARGAGTLSYGLERSDFSRTENQRKILLALRQKVFSVGTFANPAKISQLISAVGSHVRTNMQISEMLRLYELLDGVGEDKILTYGLDTSPDNYLADLPGSSDIVPRSGNYDDIQKFVREIFRDGFIKMEQASVTLLNGTTTIGLATEVAMTLESYGYHIDTIGEAPTTDYQKTQLFVRDNAEAPYTTRYLEQRFGVGAVSSQELPDTVVSESDIVIIIGSDGAQ